MQWHTGDFCMYMYYVNIFYVLRGWRGWVQTKTIRLVKIVRYSRTAPKEEGPKCYGFWPTVYHGKGAFRLPIKNDGMGKFPRWFDHVTLLPLCRLKRFTAAAETAFQQWKRCSGWEQGKFPSQCRGESCTSSVRSSVVRMPFTVYRHSRFDVVLGSLNAP